MGPWCFSPASDGWTIAIVVCVDVSRNARCQVTSHPTIGNHAEQRELGETFAAETGFLLQRDPDTVRAADVSFVSHARLRDLADYPGFPPLAPDLAAEVVSPNDESSRVEATAMGWLQAGVRVLVVDPQTKSIREYRSPDKIRFYCDGTIDLKDVLPGFKLDALELFK